MIRPTLSLRLAFLVVGFLAFAAGVVGMLARTEESVSGRLDRVSDRAFPALVGAALSS